MRRLEEAPQYVVEVGDELITRALEALTAVDRVTRDIDRFLGGVDVLAGDDEDRNERWSDSSGGDLLFDIVHQIAGRAVTVTSSIPPRGDQLVPVPEMERRAKGRADMAASIDRREADEDAA